jgi:predicted metal-dependent hydrolase
MERYLIHLKNETYLPINSREILHQARDLVIGMNAHVRLARIATSFIEFDVAIETKDVDVVIDKLAPIGDLDNLRHIVEEEIEMDQGIKDGIFYFNSERFWECHEAFEGVWKQCFGREKELVQGIILVAVAYAHAQENELRIGVAMLTRALEKLGSSPSMYHSIDVERIRTKSVEMQKINDLVLFEI